MIYYKKINPVIRHIINTLDEKHSIKNLADQAGYSKFYFLKLFKEITGYTPLDFILRTRFLNASREIIHSDKNIADTAFSYGFNSHENFSRGFKKFFGFSPASLKKNSEYKGEIMKTCFENLFVVPGTEIPLRYEGDLNGGEWNNGELVSNDGKNKYPVVNGIPKFRDDDSMYDSEDWIKKTMSHDSLKELGIKSIYDMTEYNFNTLTNIDRSKHELKAFKIAKRIGSYKGAILELSHPSSSSFAPLIYKENPEADIIINNDGFKFLSSWKELKDKKGVMKNSRFAYFDLSLFPLRTGSIDCIVTTEILSEVSKSYDFKRINLFKEAARLLNKGGKLFLLEGKIQIEEMDRINDELLEKIGKRGVEKYGHEVGLEDFIIPYEEDLVKSGFKVVESSLESTLRLGEDSCRGSELLSEFGLHLQLNSYIIEAEKI